MTRLHVLLLALSLSVPQAAHAGLAGLLSRLGSAGGKTAKLGKLGKAGGAVGKVGTVGKAAVGVTGLVATERAAAVFAGMSDDAARSAAYLARTPEGTLMMVTKGGGQTTHTADSLAVAVDELAAGGTHPTVFLDRSAAAEDALARLPANAQLILVEEGQKLPVRRGTGPDVGGYVVDTAEGAMTLSDYLAASEDEESEDSSLLFAGLAVLGVIAVVIVWWRRAAVASA